MRDSVRSRWLEFTEALEGGVPWPYADIRNLITVAYGNLIDPMSTAMSLPWFVGAPHEDCEDHPDLMAACGCAVRASREVIASQWLRLKGDPRAAKTGHLYARGLTTIRLTMRGMATLAHGKLASNHADLVRQIPDLDDMPACAQMAMNSLAWACGSRAVFPKLFEAVRGRDFAAAAVHIRMNEWTSPP